MTRKGIESKFKKAILPILTKKDFITKSELTFEKEVFKGTVFIISFNIKGYPPDDFSVQAIFTVKIYEIEKHWVEYRNILGKENNPYPYTLGFLISDLNQKLDKKYHTHFGVGRERIKNEDDLNIYIEKFKFEYEEFIIPFIKKAINIGWLDKQMNKEYLNFKLSPPFNSQYLIYRKLIVAKLTKNPKFEEMYLKFKKILENYIIKTNDENTKKQLTVLDKVYNDLK